MNMYKIIFLIIAALIIILYLVDRFTGRKITQKIIQWRPTLIALTALSEALVGVLPSNQFAVISCVLKAASSATQEAEKLYKMNQLPKEERNAYAKKLISEVLETAKIEVTPQIHEIIDGCIAVVCMLMPHNVDPTVSQDILDKAE